MPKLNFPKILVLSLGVLAMIFSLNYLILAWTEPSAPAPSNNVPAPINVGTGIQIKAGPLGINGLFTAYSGISVNNQAITDVLTPVNGSDAVNKDYVDALGSGGYGNMPLQGQSTIYSSDSHVISTIPISLPKANCQVKITVCGSTPPSTLIIGADPVARATKSVINLGPKGVVPQNPGTGPGYTGINCRATGSGDYENCPTGYNVCRPYGYGYVGDDGAWHLPSNCCPNASDYFCLTGAYPNLNSATYCIVTTDPAHPLMDCVHGYAYAEPRCPAAGASQAYIQYNDSEFTCIYCPADHPLYDSVSKNCIKSASVTTTKVGSLCSTLSTTLNYAFTDVTFANAASAPLDTAYYVGFAYSCPQ
ncbi:MAG: hypothetical protein NTZ84_00630 [Candidatus Nealsonbacteria bacterium]|nr:hypothetical protein [Candidatus Nealsonbacteria bacterium]